MKSDDYHNESMDQLNKRLEKERRKSLEESCIDTDQLMYLSATKQAYDVRHNVVAGGTYDPNNIRVLNTYNALRYIYRKRYDLRDEGRYDIQSDTYVGKVKHPVTGEIMDTNYINDLCMSPRISPYFHNKFTYSMCTIAPRSSFPFNTYNGYYKDYLTQRIEAFVKSELQVKKSHIGYTTDFFSSNIQVNPLLYPYAYQDGPEKPLYIMEADPFMERGLYDRIFKKENYVMRGNQMNIPLWMTVTDTSKYNRKIVPKNEIAKHFDSDGYPIEDDDYGYETVYRNEQYLFSDDYTKNFMYVLQNPKQYFKFLKHNNFHMTEQELRDQEIERNTIDQVKTRDQTRGYLLYDVLLDVVFDRMEESIKADKSAPVNALTNCQSFRNILNMPNFRNKFEFDGFPMDQYLAAPAGTYTQCHNEEQVMMDNCASNQIGDYVMSHYRYQYNVVFSRATRLLQYALSPCYKYRIQSPAANIMFTAFTIMAVKEAMSCDADDYRNRFLKPLETFIEYIANDNNKHLSTQNAYDWFDEVVDEEFLKDFVSEHIERVLPVLMRNYSACNFDQDKIHNGTLDPNEIDSYAVPNGSYTHVVTEEITDKNRPFVFMKAMVLLTEFFHKVEDLRYFDAATFAISYDSIARDPDTSRSLRLFADALQEACYLYMNNLGAEVFFNGEAPSYNNVVFSKSILRDEHYEDLYGLDNTRILKDNINLFVDMHANGGNDDSDTLHKHNSYHSYMSVINLYTSLVYCIHITLDNIQTNTYQNAPYPQRRLQRPQSLWTIMKRYALLMTYINANGYGIWNERLHSKKDGNINEDIMVAQRIKWLTYGLHLRVWYSDGYFYYSNYKKLMAIYNNDVNAALTDLNRLYDDHVEGVSKKCTLFYEITNGRMIGTILPNVGFALAPMAGSYTIQAMAAAFKHYVDDDRELTYVSNMIHHALKDIMVGDSMSSILGKRMECVLPLLDKTYFKNIGYNLLNGNLNRVYATLGSSKYYEVAMGRNLYLLYMNAVRYYIGNHPEEAVLLNSINHNTNYDISFFKSMTDECAQGVGYCGTWCEQALGDFINKYQDKIAVRSLMVRIINLYRLAVHNYHSNLRGLDPKTAPSKYMAIKRNSAHCFGFDLTNGPLIAKYYKGSRIMYKNPNLCGIFRDILDRLFAGHGFNGKPAITSLFGMTDAKFGFADIVGDKSVGGCVYGMYEDPMMLMIYNNIDYTVGLLKPSIQTMYMFAKDVLHYVHDTMKRMIVDLHYGGNPIRRLVEENPSLSIEEAKSLFVEDAIRNCYTIFNRESHKEDNYTVFHNIGNTGDLYDFATTIAPFMDYDYIAGQMCMVLDREESYRDVTNGVMALNNNINNRSGEYNLQVFYRDNIDTFKTQLNSIIDFIKKKKHGSLPYNNSKKFDTITVKADASTIEKMDLQQKHITEAIHRQYTNFPSTIDEELMTLDVDGNSRVFDTISANSIGVTEEEYNQILQEHHDDYVKQVSKEYEDGYNKRVGLAEDIKDLEARLSISKMLLEEAGGTEDLSRVFNEACNQPKEGSTLEQMERENRISNHDFQTASIILMTRMLKELETIKDISKSSLKHVKNTEVLVSGIKSAVTGNNTVVIDNDGDDNSVDEERDGDPDKHIETVESSAPTITANDHRLDDYNKPAGLGMYKKEDTPKYITVDPEVLNDTSEVPEMTVDTDPVFPTSNNTVEEVVEAPVVEQPKQQNDPVVEVVEASVYPNEFDEEYDKYLQKMDEQMTQEYVVNTNDSSSQNQEQLVEEAPVLDYDPNTLVTRPDYFAMKNYDVSVFEPTNKLVHKTFLELQGYVSNIVSTITERAPITDEDRKKPHISAPTIIKNAFDYEVIDFCRITPDEYILNFTDEDRYNLQCVYMTMWVDMNVLLAYEVSLYCSIFMDVQNLNDSGLHAVRWYLLYQYPSIKDQITPILDKYEPEATRLFNTYVLGKRDANVPNSNGSVIGSGSSTISDSIKRVAADEHPVANNTNESVSSVAPVESPLPKDLSKYLTEEEIALINQYRTAGSVSYDEAVTYCNLMGKVSAPKLDMDNLSDKDREYLGKASKFRDLRTEQPPSQPKIPNAEELMKPGAPKLKPLPIMALNANSTNEEIRAAVMALPFDDNNINKRKILAIVDQMNVDTLSVKDKLYFIGLIQMAADCLIKSNGQTILPSQVDPLKSFMDYAVARKEGRA